MPVADSEAISESLSASRVSGSARILNASRHGALKTRPSNGSTKKATPRVARAMTTIGTRCRLMWRSGVDEAVGLQFRLATGCENKGDEGVGEVRVLSALDHRHRIGRHHVV